MIAQLSEAEHRLLLILLFDLVSDAVRENEDAIRSLEEDFWIQVISTLDAGTMNYDAFMLRVQQMREAYQRGDMRGYHQLRKMRQIVAFESSARKGEGDGT